MEKITILMPVYNREDFIERSINSILNQTYKSIEIIIYDDGSIDKTYEIICDLAKKDNRVSRIFGTKNKGVGFARNTLLDICNTKYACWMDSDDVSHPERIEHQVKAMTEDKLVYCKWENLKTKTCDNTKGSATLMFPVNKNVLFNEDLRFGGEDRCWRKRMHEIYPHTIVDKILYSIDFHDNRIGSWKRKIDKQWNGVYNLEDIKHLSYEEAIKKYKEEYNG